MTDRKEDKESALEYGAGTTVMTPELLDALIRAKGIAGLIRGRRTPSDQLMGTLGELFEPREKTDDEKRDEALTELIGSNPRRIIYKYVLDFDAKHVDLPYGSKIMHMDGQHGKVCIWCVVPVLSNTIMRLPFAVIGTGHEFDDAFMETMRYYGSTLIGPFVWHVFFGDMLYPPFGD